MAAVHADLMKKKRERLAAAGLREVTTPLPETIIAEIDEEKKFRRLMTRGDAIAAIVLEYKQMKQAQEQATT